VIRPLEPGDAEACDAVLATLPYFFGDPVGIEDCARAVRSQRGWVAVDDDEVNGFVTVSPSSATTLEITWMAVRSGERKRGIGRQLMDAVVTAAGADGVRLLCVLTLGPSVPEDVEDSYEGTRRFYERVGFLPVKEISLTTWNNSHALLLARPLP
jgi:GNAT superfamily N-acetyltransferase